MQGYRTSDWKAFRQKVITLHDHVCVRCGRGPADGAVLQVHHKHYVAGRNPWEYPYEACEALCKGCHAEEHGKIPPKHGWEFHGFSDLGDLSGICDLCGTAYRYAFMVSHPDWKAMEVGEICCNHLTSTDDATVFMEERRRRADKKKRFVQSPRWRPWKNGSEEITQNDTVIEVFRGVGGFRLRVSGVEGMLWFADSVEAKAHAFDLIESGTVQQSVEKIRKKRARVLPRGSSGNPAKQPIYPRQPGAS